MRCWLVLPLLVLAGPVTAEPGLPEVSTVLGALGEHPSVLAARARVEAAQADARALARGPHEVAFSGSYVRRSVEREGEYDEFDTQLSRAFRLPGKAGLDREIGALGIKEAENLAEDVRHQAALRLMGYWIDWLGAAAESEIDAQAVANYERALATIRRRVELRDAAQLDADQAAAALAGARTLAEQSAGRAQLARARLQAQFPALPLPEDAPEIPEPAIPQQGLEFLRRAVIANSHEIAAARARMQRMASQAERLQRDRVADPSVGIRLFSERGGAERGAGVLFSMPLGGGHRTALAESALAVADAESSEATLRNFEVNETAASDVAEAQYRFTAWQRACEGVEAQLAALAKLRRGHELGEIDLADLLIGERLVHDAFRTEAANRTEAFRAITKLRIDSHELWLAE